MGIDLNALGSSTDKSNERKVKVLLGPLASVLSHYDEQVNVVGIDEIKSRIDAALPILQGRVDSSGNQLATTVAALAPEDQDLIHRVVAGQIHAHQLEALSNELEGYRRGNVVNAVSPSEGLTKAINESTEAAAKVVSLTSEVEALRANTDKATDDLEELFPESDDQVSPWGVGAGTFKKLHALNLTVKEKEAQLKTKVDELAAAAADAQSKADKVQQELQNVASSQSAQRPAGQPLALV